MPSSFGLALLMHALLFGGMTLAVQWRTQPAAPVVAELWSSLPPAAIIEVAPPPPPPPPPKVEPEPEREAEIALKQEKKAPPKVEPPKEEKKPEPRKEERKPEPKKEPPKEVKKVEAKKEEPPRPRTDMERILAQAQAGAAPAPGGAPTAGTTSSGSARGDGEYEARVIGCIKPHIVFVVPAGTSANVYADFRVELLPDGAVAAVRLVRASGLAGYDAAAERAILSCNPFPRRRDGTFDRSVDVRLRPVEPR
jgi:colicin import membrane protein